MIGIILAASAVVSVATFAGYAWGYSAGFRRASDTALAAQEQGLQARRGVR